MVGIYVPIKIQLKLDTKIAKLKWLSSPYPQSSKFDNCWYNAGMISSVNLGMI